MINIRKYNYFTWIEKMRGDGLTQKELGTRYLDIGCGNGEFLSQWLLSLSPEQDQCFSGVGLDIMVQSMWKKRLSDSAEIRLANADFVNSDIQLDNQSFDTVFFMNMLYVIPLERIIKFLVRSQITNLIVTYPLPRALNLYEKRHPGQNYLNNSPEKFFELSGYKIKRQHDVTRNYYLEAPARCALGSMHPLLGKISDRMGSDPAYSIVWLRRQS